MQSESLPAGKIVTDMKALFFLSQRQHNVVICPILNLFRNFFSCLVIDFNIKKVRDKVKMEDRKLYSCLESLRVNNKQSK